MGQPRGSGSPVPDPRSPERQWRDNVELMVREVVARYPGVVTHASITVQHPDGRPRTAYARYEGPGYVSFWIREESGEDPVEGELGPADTAWVEGRRREREREERLAGRRKRRD